MTDVPLTVGTWNVAGRVADRPLLDLMVPQAADVWMIQEAKGWAAMGNRMLHAVASALDMTGYLIPSNHHGCDLAMFVHERRGFRVVRERHDTSHPWWHALGHLELLVEGRELHVMNVHLAPSSPSIRRCEAEVFGLFRGWPAIAAGDYNAVPVGPLPTGHPDTDRVRRKLDQSPAEMIEAAGFFDVGAVLGNDTPTVGHVKGPLAYRCDRICSTLPTDTYRAIEVLPAEELSDHLPVLGSFDLRSLPIGGDG